MAFHLGLALSPKATQTHIFLFGLNTYLIPTTGLCLVSPAHGSPFSWTGVLPSVLFMQSHQEIQLLHFCFGAVPEANPPGNIILGP